MDCFDRRVLKILWSVPFTTSFGVVKKNGMSLLTPCQGIFSRAHLFFLPFHMIVHHHVTILFWIQDGGEAEVKNKSSTTTVSLPSKSTNILDQVLHCSREYSWDTIFANPTDGKYVTFPLSSKELQEVIFESEPPTRWCASFDVLSTETSPPEGSQFERFFRPFRKDDFFTPTPAELPPT
jgi:hypothetical protein